MERTRNVVAIAALLLVAIAVFLSSYLNRKKQVLNRSEILQNARDAKEAKRLKELTEIEKEVEKEINQN